MASITIGIWDTKLFTSFTWRENQRLYRPSLSIISSWGPIYLVRLVNQPKRFAKDSIGRSAGAVKLVLPGICPFVLIFGGFWRISTRYRKRLPTISQSRSTTFGWRSAADFQLHSEICWLSINTIYRGGLANLRLSTNPRAQPLILIYLSHLTRYDEWNAGGVIFNFCSDVCLHSADSDRANQ